MSIKSRNDELHILDVDLTGSQNGTALLIPGTTIVDGDKAMDRYVKPHLRGINLYFSDQSAIKFEHNGQEIYRNDVYAQGHLNEENIDLFSSLSGSDAVGNLTVTIPQNITVQGTIQYSLEYIGGQVVLLGTNQTNGNN